jgi:hypothetical protein
MYKVQFTWSIKDYNHSFESFYIQIFIEFCNKTQWHCFQRLRCKTYVLLVKCNLLCDLTRDIYKCFKFAIQPIAIPTELSCLPVFRICSVRKYCNSKKNWSQDFDGFVCYQHPWIKKGDCLEFCFCICMYTCVHLCSVWMVGQILFVFSI